ncbi:MAG: 8-amino-7-oxononanoate synthase [Candidatus Accumulibacter meliphilus]|jgi:hypothetical protein|uniref:8-amino-7-oxononanoate synthase n=1 Tax=Candidatus Accumulibacter meliphilus TaxID=2211374 RepID=UPI002FC36A75
MPATTHIPKSTRKGSITVTVADSGGDGAVLRGAWVSLYAHPDDVDRSDFLDTNWQPEPRNWLASERTDGAGQVTFAELDPACYLVKYEHHPKMLAQCVDVGSGCTESVCFQLPLEAQLEITFMNTDCQDIACRQPRVNDRAQARFTFSHSDVLAAHVTMQLAPGMTRVRNEKFVATMPMKNAGTQEIGAALAFSLLGPLPNGQAGGQLAVLALAEEFDVEEREPTPISGNLNVALARSETAPTPDLRLWGAIRASTEALSFDKYLRFMDLLFCSNGRENPPAAETAAYNRLLQRRFLPFTDTDAYRVLKAATEAFVMVNCGVFTGDPGVTGDADVLADLNDYLRRRDLPKPGREPYLEQVEGIGMLPYLAIIRRKLPDVPFNEPIRRTERETDLCEGFVQEKLRNPCLLELIWSYWHEECMQVQAMNAITRRFQNMRGTRQPDPLANVEVNPLRPLNNLLWGYIQDEQHRLTVARRNAEYDHHYGLRLKGRAVLDFRPADTRSKFVEAFHHLLRLCTVFYKQDDNTTVKADAFGVLNALKEVHLILSQGAHSQFGDLPPTARIEMLIQQWLLSRPEFREFLPTRVMVAYPEPWMDRVDAMKKLQGWSDTSVVHFHNLAVFGEQLLLSIRYGAWSTAFEPTQAFNFARFWRPQVLGYIHAYRAATGAELGAETVETRVDSTLPSVLLQRRLAAQQRSA